MAIYFVANTKNVNRMKLNKLFYFADKLAIEWTAFSISGQDYFADDFGPVPVSIDLAKNIIPKFSLTTVIRENGDGVFNLVEGKEFIDDEFNDKELKVLANICKKYKNTTGEEMSRISHAPNEPWDIVWNRQNGGKGKGKQIPLEALVDDTLRPQEKERRRLLRESVAKANAAFLKLPGVKARMEGTR
ncbi:MAG: SocA family protein [Desulfovibrio sp.]|uniref:Panacea domain-containing protein n=1 Tax=Desulfovibrio sp. TaxID=885 RepID=UPI001A6566F0|nr:Panacea domain-containing protein [Desulfovibrio sp.]MBD5417073.1 SocA family protein [Desulfovibrio sp.]